MATIEEFFRHKNVFVTGGTGFIGKVLLEKLLRSCPDLGNVYVLIRPKKGKNAAQRIKDITDIPLFDVLKRRSPQNLEKLVPVEGDCFQLGLGLSPSDRKMLEDNVSIVFHSAASVRFDDSLTYAVLMNTRSARDIMTLARNMPNLKAIVHVSTCYCHCDQKEVDEVMYPPKADWRSMIKLAETMDEHTLNIFTPKILDGLPNTYVYSKSLAENVVADLGVGLPVVILRPTIVIHSVADPIVGWIDNLNGPVGLLIGGGKGLVRVVLGDPDTVMDYMPVDVCAKVMCIVAWEKARSGNFLEPSVYNLSTYDKKNVTMKHMVDLGLQINKEFPLSDPLWKPYSTVTKSKTKYFLRMLYVHLLPAIILDAIINLSGNKPFLVKLHRRIYLASIALYPFTSRTYYFKHSKALQLRENMIESDKKEFCVDGIEDLDELDFFTIGANGSRRYILKEPLDSLERAKKQYRRFCLLDTVCWYLRVAIIVWIVYKSGVLQSMLPSI